MLAKEMSFIVKELILFCLVSKVTGLLDSATVQSLQQQIVDLTAQLHDLKQEVTSLKSNQAATQTGPVAFTASLRNTLANVGSHQHIVFDHVITNIGGGYKVSDGHFAAPVRGVYIFFVSLTNVPEHSASANLLKNGHWIGQALAHGSSTNSGLYVTTTLVSTVQLEAGDEVWVQNEHSFSDVEQIDGHNYSYFSGHLVNAN